MSTAAILAGGQARRFDGYQKPLLPLGHQRIVDHLLDVLGTVVDNIFVVANDQEQYQTCNVPVIRDIAANLGPIGGLYTALSHSDSNQVLIVAGDMPFLNAEFLTAINPSVPRIVTPVSMSSLPTSKSVL